jgi:S-adenosylmethionine:tRNA ribosyltransferase-isomerase
MNTEELNYHLRPALIAQQPVGIRSESRLLVLERSGGKLIDSRFDRVGQYLSGGDCLVLNDAKVLPARFFAQRRSGGKLEGLFLAASEAGVWEVMLKGGRKVRLGETIALKCKEHGSGGRYQAKVAQIKESGRYLLKIDSEAGFEAILDEVGFPPLPPYIKRGADLEAAAIDRVRYQTVYARRPGAVAAPTAGLHFTDELIQQLKEAGILFAYVTLHVGPGTFKPITVETLEAHEMEAERYSIDAENAATINSAKTKGGRIIAVGTTAVRTLETAAAGSGCQAGADHTELFITPGYKFRIVDAMVTNFHLPKSTLLALVAAFAGLDNILAAYRHAIEQHYRFYSYGDAMLIL